MANNSSYNSQFDRLLGKIDLLINNLSSTKRWDATVDVDERVGNIMQMLDKIESDDKRSVSSDEQDIIDLQRTFLRNFDEANKDYIASLNEYRQNNKAQYDALAQIIQANKNILKDPTSSAAAKRNARQEIRNAEFDWQALDQNLDSTFDGMTAISNRQNALEELIQAQWEHQKIIEKETRERKRDSKRRKKDHEAFDGFRKRHGKGKDGGDGAFSKASEMVSDAGVFGQLLSRKGGSKFSKGIGKGLVSASGGISKALGAVTGKLNAFGMAISLFDTIVGGAAKAIAEADAKAQEFQNRKNTILTEHSIALSKVYAAGYVDTVETTLKEGLAQFGTEAKIAQEQQQIDNKVLTTATATRIGSVVGNVNDTAWEALSAATDINTQQEKLNFRAEKERDKTARGIAQMESEYYNRQQIRESDIEKANLEASQEIAKVNLEANEYQKDHPYATTVNGLVGDGIVGQFNEQDEHVYKASAGNMVGTRENVDGGKYRNMNGGTATVNVLAGVASDIGLSNTVDAGYIKARTVAERDMVNDKNEYEARRAELENNTQMTDKTVSAVNHMKDVTIDAQIAMRDATLDTLNNIQKQYQKMAQTIENYALSFEKSSLKSAYGKGLTTVGNIATYRRGMGDAVIDISRRYGMKADDIIGLQDKSSEGTGRAKIGTKNDLDRMAAIGYYLNDNNLAANIASTMEIFNTGIEDAVDGMWTMVRQVNRIGLDSKKFVADAVKNLRLAQSYDFKRGKQGLLDMSKWAQEVRFNMDNLGKMIEDIQGGGLENVITKAAKLQVLGGGFAMGADPLAMMYESFADPEALAKRYNYMIQGIGHLDKNTGEVKVDAIQDQMRLRAYAEYTGQSLEDVRNQMTYNIKKDHVLPAISSTSGLTDEQQRTIVNKAYMKDGEWMVNTLDGREMRVSEVNSGNVNNVQAEDFETNVSNAISQTVAWQDKMLGLTESQTAYIALALTENGTLDENQSKRYQKALEYFRDNKDELVNITETKMGEATKAFTGFMDTFGSAEDNEIKHLAKIEELSDDILHVITEIAKKNGVNTKVYDERVFNATVEGAKRNQSGTAEHPTISIKGQNYDIKGLVKAKVITGATASGSLKFNPVLLRKAFGDDTTVNDVKSGKWTQNHVKAHGNDLFGDGFVESAPKAEQRTSTTSSKARTEPNDYCSSVQNSSVGRSSIMDGLVQMNGGSVQLYSKTDDSPMFAQASKVTPIHDGSAQLVQTDPKDSAIFAKDGGPFDKLFNGVFGKVDEIHQVVQKVEELPLETVSPNIVSDVNSEAASIGLDVPQNTTIGFDKPIEHRFSGSIRLDMPDGSSMDILKEIQNNPMLLRALTQMVSEAVSRNLNGGKTSFNGGNLVGGFGVSSS